MKTSVPPLLIQALKVIIEELEKEKDYRNKKIVEDILSQYNY